MEQDLREFLNKMYVEYGNNEVTLALSKIVDIYDANIQRGKLNCLNSK